MELSGMGWDGIEWDRALITASPTHPAPARIMPPVSPVIPNPPPPPDPAPRIMPPPASLEKAVGEKRLTNYAPCGVSICPELDTDTILEGVGACLLFMCSLRPMLFLLASPSARSWTRIPSWGAWVGACFLRSWWLCFGDWFLCHSHLLGAGRGYHPGGRGWVPVVFLLCFSLAAPNYCPSWHSHLPKLGAHAMLEGVGGCRPRVFLLLCLAGVLLLWVSCTWFGCGPWMFDLLLLGAGLSGCACCSTFCINCVPFTAASKGRLAILRLPTHRTPVACAEDKEARQQKLSDAAFHAVDACYRDLVKAIRDPSARGSSYTQPWLARPQKPLSYP